MGDATGIPTVVIRKRSYGMKGEVAVDVSTGYSNSRIYINDIAKGEKIVIVDDVISTGGTLEPLLEKLEQMGVILHDIIIAIEKGASKVESRAVRVAYTVFSSYRNCKWASRNC